MIIGGTNTPAFGIRLDTVNDYRGQTFSPCWVCPAMAVPTGVAGGLPGGIQIVGACTDARRLFDYRVANANDSIFFIRKGIGWTLRQFAYAGRMAVQKMLTKERARFTPLSLREAGKHLPLPNAETAKEGIAS